MFSMGYHKEGRVAVVCGLVDCSFSTDQLTELTREPDKRIGV